MKDLLQQFARGGKEWLGLWSFVVLLLCIYAVFQGTDLPDGVVEAFGLVLVCYTGNRSLKDWVEKRVPKKEVDDDAKGIDNPDAQ